MTPEECAYRIRRLYDDAYNRECTCGSAPEDPCSFCSAWDKARIKSVKLIKEVYYENN